MAVDMKGINYQKNRMFAEFEYFLWRNNLFQVEYYKTEENVYLEGQIDNISNNFSIVEVEISGICNIFFILNPAIDDEYILAIRTSNGQTWKYRWRLCLSI